ncbi:choice-of-anchor D domain-containing protein [Micromonospora sp. C28SCA-DRY-2]|uniref:choice-of-anchor D domain-containing protein n=1 Tax=Micromonospora sp. C28SCA-DRY-2 TaxID=3059522 RepID=UPI0026766292|nr:choice-of-anchor D domain-containing protein [Micromonospora sp. C28SCA-DRY-2]MDO3703825.1 choice-of-anchor D domain-containing protein [Micromonospora sp. C28SCA-DRY-2]
MIGTITAMVAVTAVATPAGAAAAPAAPYTALTVDGNPFSWWHQGSRVFDQAGGAAFTVTPGAGDALNLRADQAGDAWTFRMAPPSGETWTAGTTYELTGVEGAEDFAFIDVAHNGATCTETPGYLSVSEATRDAGTDRLTSFAAYYVISCGSSRHDLFGEIRWNSTVGYAAAGTDTMSHDFGDRLVGGPAASRTITVRSMGSDPVEYGTARFDTPGAYSITADTCSGTTRAAGETCTVTVSVRPTKLGGEWNLLVLPDNTVVGERMVQLGVNGVDPRTVSVAPASLAFGDQYIAETGGTQSVTVTGTGDTPVTFGAATIGGTDASSFAVKADTCKGATLAKNQTCRVDVVAKAAGGGARSATLQLPNDSLTNPRTVPLTLNGVVGATGTYYPLTPARIMDTRTGNGAPKAKLGPNGTVNLQVTGRGGVPSAGVGAVVLNVTVAEPTASSYLTVYPAGRAKPTASSLNFGTGWVRSNSVTVAVGTGGKVAITNHAGSTQAIVDVVGYYASDNTPIMNGIGVGGQLQPVAPLRLFDSRSDWGSKLPAGDQVRLAVNYGPEANARMRAVVVNITAVSPSASGFLTAWNGEWPEPPTSTVNYATGSVTPNLAVVPVRRCYDCPWGAELPTFGVYTHKDSHVIVDIVGFIDDGGLANGLRFDPKTPTRIVDSRIGQGLPTNPGPAVIGTVTTPGSVVTDSTRALALNVTAVSPTASTYLKLWPNGVTGIDRPDVSNLNAAAGQTVANAAVTLIGPTDAFNVYNHSGTTGVVADVVGTYWLYPGTASGSAVSGDTSRSPYRLGELPTPDKGP